MMKMSAQMLRTGLAALLTLAFIVIWPPVDYGSASFSHHAAQTGTHGQQTHTEQHGLLNIKTDADCDASAIGCCMMAHCYPGISVGPHDMPGFVSDDGTTAASAVRGTGSDPGMVLPPPRNLSV